MFLSKRVKVVVSEGNIMMAAGAMAPKPRCEVVELSSDEEEEEEGGARALMPKVRESTIEHPNQSQIADRASQNCISSKSIGSMPKAPPAYPSLSDDVFTFGFSSDPPPDDVNFPPSQALHLPATLPTLPRPTSSLYPPLDDDTPIRQATKRRKLHLLSDTSSAFGGPALNGNSSYSTPKLGSEPRIGGRDTTGDTGDVQTSRKLKALQATLGFSDDDSFNFEVAADGADDLLQWLEEAQKKKAREELDFRDSMRNDSNGDFRTPEWENLGQRSEWDSLREDLGNKTKPARPFKEPCGTLEMFSGPRTIKQNSERAPLRERSSNILRGFSDPPTPQSAKRKKHRHFEETWQEFIADGLGEIEEGETMPPRKLPAILDLSEFFDDGLDETLPPVEKSVAMKKATESWRPSPKEKSGKENDGESCRISTASFGERNMSAAELGERRVSIVSLDSDLSVLRSSRKDTNLMKRPGGDVWDLNMDEQPEQSDGQEGIDASLNIGKTSAKRWPSLENRGKEVDIFEDNFELFKEDSGKQELCLSQTTAQLLATISAKSKPKPRYGGSTERIKDGIKAVPKRSDLSRTASLQSASYGPISDSEGPSKKSAAPKRPRLTSVEREEQRQEKEKERARKAEERAKEREGKEEQKRLEKERKAREKRVAADLAEANKARTDRKVTSPEMIVDLPRSMEDTSVHTQIAPFLSDLKVQWITYDSPIPDVIKFRRKVTARWSDALGHWEPVPETIESEKHIVCLIPGKDFARMASQENGLENHVTKVAREYPGSQPIYLIEGIEAMLRKSRNSNNRAFVATVRNHLANGQGIHGQRRKGATADEHVDADTIEDSLLRLQVVHHVLVHHTDASVETAQWIAVFTQHISTIPYK